MVTVGAVMNQATPTPVWICSGVTPVARRVHQTLSISVSLLPHLLITPIHVDLVSIPWTSVVHSQLCLCITLSYSFLQRCSFLYLGPSFTPPLSGSLPWTLNLHFPCFFFCCQLVFMCHILSSHCHSGSQQETTHSNWAVWEEFNQGTIYKG